MTSNIGSQIIKEFSGKDKEEMENRIMDMLRETFKPEFLNRIDETIIFNSLDKAEIKKIVDIQINKLIKRLRDRKIQLKLTEPAKEFLSNVGFDPVYGARPLKRAIQHYIEDELALKIISSDITDGDDVTVEIDNGKVVFS